MSDRRNLYRIAHVECEIDASHPSAERIDILSHENRRLVWFSRGEFVSYRNEKSTASAARIADVKWIISRHVPQPVAFDQRHLRHRSCEIVWCEELAKSIRWTSNTLVGATYHVGVRSLRSKNEIAERFGVVRGDRLDGVGIVCFVASNALAVSVVIASEAGEYELNPVGEHPLVAVAGTLADRIERVDDWICVGVVKAGHETSSPLTARKNELLGPLRPYTRYGEVGECAGQR